MNGTDLTAGSAGRHAHPDEHAMRPFRVTKDFAGILLIRSLNSAGAGGWLPLAHVAISGHRHRRIVRLLRFQCKTGQGRAAIIWDAPEISRSNLLP
jgi:hypothetical protein